MSRPRVIEQDKILDAAESVVVRDGAARLTLDAVAIAAGISKASVIYDFKSKQALIKAVIDRRFAEENDKVCAATEKLGPIPNARIHGRIAAAKSTQHRDTPAVAVNLCAALSQDATLQETMQAYFRQEISTILQTSSNPRGAFLAFLAVEGLMVLEYLGLHSWPEPARSEILREIDAFVEAAPSEPPLNIKLFEEDAFRAQQP